MVKWQLWCTDRIVTRLRYYPIVIECNYSLFNPKPKYGSLFNTPTGGDPHLPHCQT